VTWHRAWARLRRDAVDVLIVALAVAVEVEVLVKGDDLDLAVLAPLSLFFVLPLLFRRATPSSPPASRSSHSRSPQRSTRPASRASTSAPSPGSRS